MTADTITSVKYTIEAVEPTTGDRVPAVRLEFPLGEFSCTLDADRLIAVSDNDYGSPEAAVQALTPFLRAWQVWSLTVNGVSISLKLQSVDVRGMSVQWPRPATHVEISIGRARHKDPKLSAPPGGIGPASESIYNASLRWREVLGGIATTPTGAYGVLTVLEHMYGNRHNVAEKLNVSRPLLSRLGRLVSIGDTRSGRKVGDVAADRRPLTDKEERWIEGLIRHLIARSLVIEVGGIINEKLTVKDYPLNTETYLLQVDQAATARAVFRS